MKIIKVNNSQEKVKYEIYNMQLNQEKARRYREELAKKIEFYRLEFEDAYDFSCNIGFGLKDFINNNAKNIAKLICEFREIPKDEKSVIYGDSMEVSVPDYQLYPYDEHLYHSQLFKKNKQKGLRQQKYFLQQFIEKGIATYDFRKFDIENAMHAYIFLNSFDYRSECSPYSCVDNVVYLPNEIMVMYLLEKGYIEEAHYYINKIVDIEEEQKLFANFEFEKSTEFTQAQMQDLLSSGLLKEQTLTRKRELDLYLTNFIK